jgi:VCBS repeat protein
VSAVVQDFNNDGIPDIATANETGSFLEAEAVEVTADPAHLATADFNNDGNADLVVSGATTQLLLSNGDGTFAVGQTIFGFGGDVRTTDVNQDQNLDVLLNHGGLVYVALGKGDATFRSSRAYSSGTSSDGFLLAVDANGDGLPDALVAESAQITPLFLLENGSLPQP